MIDIEKLRGVFSPVRHVIRAATGVYQRSGEPS